MKFLKLGLFSLLAILAVSVFLTSCEQETINIDTLYDTAVNYDYQKAIPFDNGGSKSKNAINAVIQLSSDNEELLSFFNKKNMQIEKNKQIADEYMPNKKGNKPEHNGTCHTHEETAYGPFDKHLKIEVILDANPDEESGYTLSFSDELTAKFEGQNIVTTINFLTPRLKKETLLGDYYGGAWIDLAQVLDEYTAMNAKSAVFIGGGQDTKVRTYHSHNDQGTNPHPLSTKYFKKCHYTYDCQQNHILTHIHVSRGFVDAIEIYTHCGGRC